MRRKYLPRRQHFVVALLSLALVGFAAAQAVPMLRGAGLPQAYAGGQTAPGPSPTPSPPYTAEQVSPPSQSRRRDLTLYDKAGPLGVSADAQSAERDAVMAQARGFLLGHWRGRRRGQLVLHSPDADGRHAASSFYVEPDESGQWCVVLERPGGAETFRFVEEVELSEEGQPILEPTAEDGPRLSGRRGLHLKESPEANSGLVL